MRTWGRTYDANGKATWVEVSTDKNGLNDYVYATAVCQELKLNLGESPFWGDRGIPAKESVVMQVAPDFYSLLVQQNYSQHFLSITVSRVPAGTPDVGQLKSIQPNQIKRNGLTPTYNVNIVTHYGVTLETVVAT